MSGIIYPTLDLFLYDLRNGLGESQDEIKQNQAYYQKKIPEHIHQNLFQKDTYFEDEYVLLTEPRRFEKISKPYSFQGYYYPVRLSDVYGLLIDCSVNNEIETQSAECFKDLKIEIEQRINNQSATIGQTWMISGWLPQSAERSPEDIAKDCYKALMPDSIWKQDLEGQGTFLGATIFELSRYRLKIKESPETPTTIQSIQENQHVIIILFPDKASADKLAEFYDDWMRLFEYRHKILWAYGQSRLLKQSIKNYFTLIEEDRQSINLAESKQQEFEKFRQTLMRVQYTLNNYAIELNRLEFQNRTIDINLSNYKKRLERIGEKAGNKLEFLEKFTKLATDKYQLQITKDSENLERGMKLLENTISAVRSRVEVAKAERERNFQDAVAILGVGWSVGSFVASRSNLGKDPKDPVRLFLTNSSLVPKPLLESAIPLTYTLSIALVAAAVAWLLIRLWPGLSSVIPKLGSIIPKSKKE